MIPTLCDKICSYGVSNPWDTNDRDEVKSFYIQLFAQHKKNLTPKTKYLFCRAGLMIRISNIYTAYVILYILCKCPGYESSMENTNDHTMEGLSTCELQQWVNYYTQ